MRRLSAGVLAGAILMLPAFSHRAFAQQAAAPQKTTYSGDLVLAAYAINGDKTADYEKVIATLRDSLSKSERPEAKQQMAGWKIIRNSTPQPDGSVVYIHIITPIPDADYSISNLVYEVVTDPEARTAFFELYRGALQKPLFVIQGPMVADFSR